jgi:hypothetical protein
LLLIDNLFLIKSTEPVPEGKNEFEHLEESSLDLINLKIFALLMCIGKPEHKGEVLFDMCAGSANDKVDKTNKEEIGH